MATPLTELTKSKTRHDLGTVLAVLRTASDLLKNDGANADEITELLGMCVGRINTIMAAMNEKTESRH